MTERILKEGTCSYCKKIKYEFTRWPSDHPRCSLLCDDCAEEMLTAEAFKERTGKTSKKEK